MIINSSKNSNNQIKITCYRIMRKGIKGVYDKILKIIYKIFKKNIIWIDSSSLGFNKPNKNGRIYSNELFTELIESYENKNIKNQ